MSTRGASAERPKRSFLCRTCGKKVRIPQGWSSGAASRRHYWAKHPEVMRGKGARR